LGVNSRKIFPGKNLSKATKYHKKYPYLLKNKVIRYPNQVWSTDITYIKLPGGNVYLMAIIDWFSRKVLSWRVFNTMDAIQYANLLCETIEEYGCPAIFNTDQGSTFTSDVFTGVFSKNTELKSVWTAVTGLWTISESNVFGEV